MLWGHSKGKESWAEFSRILLFCLVLSASPLPAGEFRAGAAQIDITPPIGGPLWGYSSRHDAPSLGVLDPLQARALVLEVGTERLAIVSLDLGRAPPRKTTAAILVRVKTDAAVNHVFLVASHTHHGPVLELDNWPDPQNPYLRQLERKIGDVVVEAARRLKEARFGIASKEIDFNHNRHSHLPDKPVDKELLVLRIEDDQDKMIAQVVNFAAHPTMQDVKIRKLSADYPGVLAKIVEKESGVPCLFLQGAAGDLAGNSEKGEGPELFGRALAREVLELAKTIRCVPAKSSRLLVAEDDFNFGRRLDLGNPFIKLAYARLFFPGLVDFYEKEYRDGVRPHLTTALLDDRIGFVGVSGEFFCEHSLHLKKRARLEHLLFLGYCNDYQQYFPTIEAAAEGGYGGDPRVSPVEVGAGERMMDRALIRLFQMRGKFPKGMDEVTKKVP